MATILINNLDQQMLERFKTFAKQQGVSVSVFRGEEQILAEAENTRLNDVLLAIPQVDGYDDEDIFARVSQTDNQREIDW